MPPKKSNKTKTKKYKIKRTEPSGGSMRLPKALIEPSHKREYMVTTKILPPAILTKKIIDGLK